MLKQRVNSVTSKYFVEFFSGDILSMLIANYPALTVLGLSTTDLSGARAGQPMTCIIFYLIRLSVSSLFLRTLPASHPLQFMPDTSIASRFQPSIMQQYTI